MKHLKSFRLFESVWSTEEFIDEIRKALSKYNLSSVEVREIINRVDIEGAIENGEQPNVIINKLIEDLNLKSLGNSGFNSWRTSKSWQSEIKYL
jgi:hypothetical protein